MYLHCYLGPQSIFRSASQNYKDLEQKACHCLVPCTSTVTLLQSAPMSHFCAASRHIQLSMKQCSHCICFYRISMASKQRSFMQVRSTASSDAISRCIDTYNVCSWRSIVLLDKLLNAHGGTQLTAVTPRTFVPSMAEICI